MASPQGGPKGPSRGGGERAGQLTEEMREEAEEQAGVEARGRKKGLHTGPWLTLVMSKRLSLVALGRGEPRELLFQAGWTPLVKFRLGRRVWVTETACDTDQTPLVQPSAGPSQPGALKADPKPKGTTSEL